MEYQYIVNPTTNRKCRIDTALGKRIIKGYAQSGGGVFTKKASGWVQRKLNTTPILLNNRNYFQIEDHLASRFYKIKLGSPEGGNTNCPVLSTNELTLKLIDWVEGDNDRQGNANIWTLGMVTRRYGSRNFGYVTNDWMKYGFHYKFKTTDGKTVILGNLNDEHGEYLREKDAIEKYKKNTDKKPKVFVQGPRNCEKIYSILD